MMDVIDNLLDKSPIHFTRRTLHEIPEEVGIYIFTNWKDGEHLYVGQTQKGFRSRLLDHWDGTESSDLAKNLVRSGIVPDLSEARKWIAENVVVRCLAVDESGTDISSVEPYVIGVLNPRLNRQHRS